jgi:hypothetical protein
MAALRVSPSALVLVFYAELPKAADQDILTGLKGLLDDLKGGLDRLGGGCLGEIQAVKDGAGDGILCRVMEAPSFDGFGWDPVGTRLVEKYA